MMKFVKKRTATATSPQQAVEISRPTNLIVSKHRLVRTDGDFILIMEGDKVIGLVDKKDLDGNTLPQILPPPSITPPTANAYLIPTSSSSSQSIKYDPPAVSSPVGFTPESYQKNSTGRKQTPPHFTSQMNLADPDSGTRGYHRSASVEQLLQSPQEFRERSESSLKPKGSGKYDTIPFFLTGGSSAQCNVEIRLGDERCPPPPNRAPPAPLMMSPVHCVIFEPQPVELGYTEVRSVSVQDPEIEAMSMEELKKHAEEFETFIQEQVQQKWRQEKAQTEIWIQKIAGNVAKSETMNTIRSELKKKSRPTLESVFKQEQPVDIPVAQDPTDPKPNHEYERLYVSRQQSSPANSPQIKRQSTHESDGDIEDMRF